MSDLVAKEGSYAWAILQLQAGKCVRRKNWGGKYAFLIRNPGLTNQTVKEGDYWAHAGVEVGTRFNYLSGIEHHASSGNVISWVALPNDLDGNDWEVLTRVSEPSDMASYWARMSVTPSEIIPGKKWGDNNARTGIVSYPSYGLDGIYWTIDDKINDGVLSLRFSFREARYEDELQKATSKKLTITVNGVAYHLGHYSALPEFYEPHYRGDEAKKIGELLMQKNRQLEVEAKWYNY
ncbi:DUF2829 domain-containing protein [Xenorhabdus sp. XENO-7]|uniref:DUF2829 domain-containing protein n=1 Tax=Xenorhabdus aichiensis TaxID=3025874 RepID=A0ABT5M6A0_9GAMM|nr:MW1434 family type I TA system toxin [Xenorhabdus aichiensis]MDC9623204.1 DUF2829 domain-containing protein [Xenorhabdus aichiensis]